jgi:hypothetical protein
MHNHLHGIWLSRIVNKNNNDDDDNNNNNNDDNDDGDGGGGGGDDVTVYHSLSYTAGYNIVITPMIEEKRTKLTFYRLAATRSHNSQRNRRPRLSLRLHRDVAYNHNNTITNLVQVSRIDYWRLLQYRYSWRKYKYI